MARGRRGRDASDIASSDPLNDLSDLLSPVVPFAPVRVYAPPVPLSGVEDGRRWTPDPLSALSWSGAEARTVMRPVRASSPSRLVERLGFSVPDEVLVCVRRKQRREVLHALRRAGRGGGKPRWTWRSEIKC